MQAEDGIPNYKVTGVQTCALPISQQRGGFERYQHREGEPGAIDRELIHRERKNRQQRHEPDERRQAETEIGRASCRERGGGTMEGTQMTKTTITCKKEQACHREQ